MFKCYLTGLACDCGGFEAGKPCPKDANETYGGNIFDDVEDMHAEFDHLRSIVYVLDGQNEAQ